MILILFLLWQKRQSSEKRAGVRGVGGTYTHYLPAKLCRDKNVKQFESLSKTYYII